jgi:hypothetical protein
MIGTMTCAGSYRSFFASPTPSVDNRRRWQGVAPTPPSLSEAVEELTTTVEELHTINEELTQSQQAALETQQRYLELFDGVPEAYLVTDL